MIGSIRFGWHGFGEGPFPLRDHFFFVRLKHHASLHLWFFYVEWPADDLEGEDYCV